MGVMFLIVHPARVHLYKNVIKSLNLEGIETHVLVKNDELITRLLDTYNISYTIAADEHTSILELGYQQCKFELRAISEIIQKKPDVVVGGVITPLFARMIGTSAIDFFDTDHLEVMNRVQAKFLNTVYTPDCYRINHGRGHMRYPSYHELAYLHPNRFNPDPEFLHNHGLCEEDTIVVLRLVNWKAVHDVGNRGIRDVDALVEYLENNGAQVVITAEGNVPPSLADKQLSIEPHNIHHLLFYADLFIGESATMAIESAVLGTPSIYLSTLDAGVLHELENKYGLVFRFTKADEQVKALIKAKSILKKNKAHWEQRREQLLEDKIDTTDYILRQILEMESSI
jgi:predicted glycosyltransferase